MPGIEARRARLLSDNGPSQVSGELASLLGRHRIEHTRGTPYHPKAPGSPWVTQGKIALPDRSMTSPGARPGKNLIKLQNYAIPRDLEQVSHSPANADPAGGE